MTNQIITPEHRVTRQFRTIRTKPAVLFLSVQAFQGFLDRGSMAIYAIEEWWKQRQSNAQLEPMGSDVLIGVPYRTIDVLEANGLLSSVTPQIPKSSSFDFFVLTAKQDQAADFERVLASHRVETDQAYLLLQNLATTLDDLYQIRRQWVDLMQPQATASIDPPDNRPVLLGNVVDPTKPAFPPIEPDPISKPAPKD